MGAWKEDASYEERLIHALRHPLSEVRMGAIISLGNRKGEEAAVPLATCALEHPHDIVQNLEIVRSLEKIPDCAQRRSAVQLLKSHPSHMVRARVVTME